MKILTATQGDYQDHLPIYMIKQHDFISYVLVQWQHQLTILEHSIKYYFNDYDKFHNRG